MSRIVVCGGSMIGLTAAMLLARDGHDVTVLEGDPAGPPEPGEAAWSGWKRSGVTQFHQPHNLFPGFRRVVDAELPGLTDQLLAAGCVWEDPLGSLPPSLPDASPRPGDDRFRFVTGRRPVVESVVAAAAEEQRDLEVRRGVRVAGLLTGTSRGAGVPHVRGVRTVAGEEIVADLVIDAMGRKTPSATWLTEVGAPAPETRSQDCGFTYYTRYFSGPTMPAKIGPVLAPIGCITLLTLVGDNDTWSVTVFTATGDAPLKELRDNEAFTRVLRGCPLQAHWLDGTPITDVLPMAGILDRYRRFVVDGRPVATGFAAVGDAWGCTNPSAGRGISVGTMHAQLLRDVVRAHAHDPLGFASAWDEATETVMAPWYWNQIAADRVRIAEMNALRDGTEPPPGDERVLRFVSAAMRDPEVFRGMLETALCLATPQEVLARPEIAAKVAELGSTDVMRIPGPDRGQLLQLIAG